MGRVGAKERESAVAQGEEGGGGVGSEYTGRAVSAACLCDKTARSVTGFGTPQGSAYQQTQMGMRRWQLAVAKVNWTAQGRVEGNGR